MTNRNVALAATLIALSVGGASSCKRKAAGITYRVTGTAGGPVEIRYMGQGFGSMSSETVLALPWTRSFPQQAPAMLNVSVGWPSSSAPSAVPGAESVTCEILVDGRTVAQATTNSGYPSRADCSAPLSPF